MCNYGELERNIIEGSKTAFIDNNIQSNNSYKPQFVSNNSQEGSKVITTIEDELMRCDEFSISVAFITKSGLTPLLQTLRELERAGKKGRVLTTDYLCFSEPEALDRISLFNNIELRMFCTDASSDGFHTKGYIFKSNEVYTIITGSSNITLSALTKNKEWNSKIVSKKDGEYAKKVLGEFEELWCSDNTLPFSEFIGDYKVKYSIVKEQKRIAKEQTPVSLEQYKLKPNKMQVQFVDNIMNLIKSNKHKALLISATGTGKTYASAFALREINPQKVLFVVHREIIAKQAMASYKLVFGNTKSFAFYTRNGNNDCDYLFGTMTMMAKEDVQQQFRPDEFDLIVVDEAHRTGSESYQKIMSYFEPKFWLGMTATPERTDGFDIYALFDHNIAYEIRLQQAMEYDMLCPFHYFGISDLEIDGEVFDDDTLAKNFKRLTSDSRVDHVLSQIEFYGHSGTRAKGLVFCSRNDEAEELSARFNDRGYKTIALSGTDPSHVREDAIDRLTSDGREDKLDYIFTVDIFNEGVDIPDVNQVILLRPTKSPIVFVQQLGRGLRKADNKEYVIVLDFIANYQNNFMIPIALSGDRSYNKDNVRRYLQEGTKIIPGSSTVHFDEVSRRRVFQAIDSANFNNINLIKESYRDLKYKLGHIPELMDFDTYGTIDPLRIFDSSSLGSYHMFLKKHEKEYTIEFNKIQELFLEYVSRKFASGKRPHELLIIKGLIEGSKSVFKDLSYGLFAQNGRHLSQKEITNLVNVLTGNFATGSGAATYAECVFIERFGDDYAISAVFADVLKDDNFKKELTEVVNFGLYRNKVDYGRLYKGSSFKLYSKYTYDDVCRLLCWEKGEVALNIGGYKYDKTTNTYPVFINYDKSEDISDTTKYEDRFVSDAKLIAISKSGRTIMSEDVQAALNADKREIIMDLFVRKNKDDKISKEFYYMGRIHATGETTEFVMPNTTSKAVEITYNLETPVREDVFDYITA